MTPVQRVGWSDEAVAGGARTDPVAIGRRRPADPLLVAVVIAGLVIALAKPWGGPRVAAPVVVGSQPTVLAAPATAPPAFPLSPAELPSEVFAPLARTCMQDMGWRVCALGAGGAADQLTINHFAPLAPALVDAGNTPAAADPVVVLATSTAATLAFYAPNGFYFPDAQQAPRPTDEPNGRPVIASGPVSISAWYVDEHEGSLTLPLRGGSPMTQDGRVAANVFVPATEQFNSGSAWAAGRYIVWIKGVGSRNWQELFDFDVVGDRTAAR